MKKILSVLMWLYYGTLFIVFFLLTIPVFLLTFWFDPYRKISNEVFMQIGSWMLYPVQKGSVRIVGAEHFPKNKPVVCVSNHQSFLDMPLMAKLPWKMKWISKKELFFIPVVGWVLFMTGHIAINRKKGGKAFSKLDASVPFIKAGNPLMIFPEGTRSRDGVLKSFKRGAFQLAYENEFELLPIILHGTREILPAESWIFNKRNSLSLQVLPALHPSNYDSWEEMADDCRNIMMKHL